MPEHTTTHRAMPGKPRRLLLPNSFLHSALRIITEATTASDTAAILKRAGLEQYAEDFPPDDAQREVPFATFAALLTALEAHLHPRAAQAVQVMIGRAWWVTLLQASGDYWAKGFFHDLQTPLERLNVLLPAVAYSLEKYSDIRAQAVPGEGFHEFSITRCPLCLGRSSSTPLCHVWRGLLGEALRYAAADGPLAWRIHDNVGSVVALACVASGDAAGRLVLVGE